MTTSHKWTPTPDETLIGRILFAVEFDPSAIDSVMEMWPENFSVLKPIVAEALTDDGSLNLTLIYETLLDLDIDRRNVAKMIGSLANAMSYTDRLKRDAGYLNT